MTRRLQLATPFKDSADNGYPFVDVRLWKLSNYVDNQFPEYDDETGLFDTVWDIEFILYFYRVDGTKKILLLDADNKPIQRILSLPRTINLGPDTDTGYNIYRLFYIIEWELDNPPDFTNLGFSPFEESWLHTDSASIVLPFGGGTYYATTGLRDLLILQGGTDFAGLTVVEV